MGLLKDYYAKQKQAEAQAQAAAIKQQKMLEAEQYKAYKAKETAQKAYEKKYDTAAAKPVPVTSETNQAAVNRPASMATDDIHAHLSAIKIAEGQGTDSNTLDVMWSDLKAQLREHPELGDLAGQLPDKYDDVASQVADKGLALIDSQMPPVADNATDVALQQQVADMQGEDVKQAKIAELQATLAGEESVLSPAQQKAAQELQKMGVTVDPSKIAVKDKGKAGAKTSSSGSSEEEDNPYGFKVSTADKPQYEKVLGNSTDATQALQSIEKVKYDYDLILKNGAIGTGPIKTSIQKWLSTAGQTLGVEGSQKVISGLQGLQKDAVSLIAQIKKSFGPQISNSDIQIMLEALPNAWDTPEAFASNISKLEFASKMSQQQANFYSAYGAKYGNIAGAEAAWNHYLADYAVYDDDGNITDRPVDDWKTYIDHQNYQSPYANVVLYGPDGVPVKGTLFEYEAKKAGMSVEEAAKKYGFTAKELGK